MAGLGDHSGTGPHTIRGRGSADNPPNRFERTRHERDPDAELSPDEDTTQPAPRTEFLPDSSRSIIARNTSPDIPFDASINPYRGCEHGCSYCYARPTHEYLGLSAGLDFETKILVKHEAPALLRKALTAPGWRVTPLAIGGVTDPYQPAERSLRLTRGCLEVLAEFRHPVSIVTKNRLVVRDVDLLSMLARERATAVYLSITTLDATLARVLEPRTSPPFRRLQAVEELTNAGVPVGVMVAPIIPGLNDHEIPAILSAAAQAGARHAGYIPLRLPLAVAPLFEDWLDRHRPGQKSKILGRIRGMRGGQLYDGRFGHRMRGEGTFASMIDTMFRTSCQRAGLNADRLVLSTEAFRRPGDMTRQLRLFD